MIESIVKISMQEDNDLDCSYAIIDKGNVSVIIILKDTECGIFDYSSFKKEDFVYKYLLLKHYSDASWAYKDFLKLIGKMCKKALDSKYFLNHKQEDNRMVFVDMQNEHTISEEEREGYRERYCVFQEFVLDKRSWF